MHLEGPSFWWQAEGTSLAAKLLSPLGAIYHWETQRRLKKPGARAGIPVICIGNATVGGVGKTPFVRALGEALQARGHAPHILTRGYGGKEKGPYCVRPEDDAAHVGDEPLLLARTLPVWVSRDRPMGAKAAKEAGASMILMDDGFQNPSLQKSLSLMLVDAATLFGNDEVFPAGPLRERPEAAASRAGALVAVLPGPETQVPDRICALADGKPVFRAWFEVEQSSIPDAPLHAFCGIGRPERFERSLKESGGKILSFKAFPDHHPFSSDEIDALKADAIEAGATLVTTEKDYVRFPPERRDGITPIPGGMRIAEEEALLSLVENAE
ncbi:tetraacyldisaccharide 4'-kinase [Parvularcula sp. ZS-1/3]|uniref:Tetraacyldisaccharide 4'-kinase n=1 Tax=Parvularcula mediterranea TaxID=2732508 RepID=A0A7Y3RLX4_9PROT|nr:tetraacyldisaccharide 4'-kinase [Parvularcula mediterranea]NNU16405.1 tetraacyldisaccharide 4'-kinase [Parvularcula mediterranea]